MARALRIADAHQPNDARTEQGAGQPAGLADDRQAGLPHDYPMVAPEYAETRSTLAKTFGLGRKQVFPKAPPVVTAPARPNKGCRISEITTHATDLSGRLN